MCRISISLHLVKVNLLHIFLSGYRNSHVIETVNIQIDFCLTGILFSFAHEKHESGD